MIRVLELDTITFLHVLRDSVLTNPLIPRAFKCPDRRSHRPDEPLKVKRARQHGSGALRGVLENAFARCLEVKHEARDEDGRQAARESED